jgi:dipeptidyl aminopeptidase/acylaminoacyl peptidase
LVVWSHGGPTGSTSPGFTLGRQFWTSRGFALVDVNYRGSTGYGRAYRNALRGQWGLIDTDDCIAAARYLADQGLVDGLRMAIRGGSAGGYTTLCALTFHDEFATGASYFGVADIGALAAETHKLESRYMDSMVGPYPEAADLYRERSPVHHTEKLSRPMVILQGLDDEVVLPNQAEMMIEALDRKGIPYAYLAFEGEGHGFRKAENIERSAEAELFFYGWVFGFVPAGDIPPVEIHNS